ncbi:MAG: c-type cytochrome [Planctomycetes bacterium]|nr:c-type cytochrome [Planctomycetota bacterium]
MARADRTRRGHALLLLLAAPCALAAQEAPARPQGVRVVVEALRPGAGRATDQRVDRLVALGVPAGTAPSALTAPGPFRVTWSGYVNVPLRERVVFVHEGEGTFALELEGKPVLASQGTDATRRSQPVRLAKGATRFVARATSNLRGELFARLLWEGTAFRAEPLPPAALTYDPEPALAEAEALRAARTRFALLRCAACHPPTQPWSADAAMPELTRDAPDLRDAGARLSASWVAAWLLDPRRFHPQSEMPRLLHGSDAEQARDARDLAAWLAGLGTAPADPAAAGPAAPAAGGALFARLGCIGCHQRPDAEGAAGAPDLVPLRHAAAKFRPGALAAFLRAPARGHAWTRMPDFQLGADEAEALAAFLAAKGAPPSAEAGAGDAARGARRAAELGCANCHALPGGTAPRAALELARLAQGEAERGCLGADAAARGTAPDFALDAAARAGLRAFVRTAAATLASDAPAEFAARTVARLQCTACHSLDGARDRWTLRAGEVRDLGADAAPGTPPAEGSVSQGRPALTWAGEKVQTDWLVEFLAGRSTERTRPWLHARMPAFPAVAAPLARGLALAHGQRTEAEAPPVADPVLVAAGQRLIGQSGGFACVTCHGIGTSEATQVFEAPGIHFRIAARRLRSEYYRRWLFDPLRIDPATRMPKFADEQGRTAIVDVLGGDAARQFAAIWHHLRVASRDR